MSHGGRRERLARHLCACYRKWPKDEVEERRRWRALDHATRDLWRFLAIRATRFLQDEDRREHEAEVRSDEVQYPEHLHVANGLCAVCQAAEAAWAAARNAKG